MKYNNNDWFDVNRGKLQGNLINDVLAGTTSTGKAYARFTFAVHEGSHTSFHKCVAWDHVAQKLANYHKGDKLIANYHVSNDHQILKDPITHKVILRSDNKPMKIVTTELVINSFKQVTFKKNQSRSQAVSTIA